MNETNKRLTDFYSCAGLNGMGMTGKSLLRKRVRRGTAEAKRKMAYIRSFKTKGGMQTMESFINDPMTRKIAEKIHKLKQYKLVKRGGMMRPHTLKDVLIEKIKKGGPNVERTLDLYESMFGPYTQKKSPILLKSGGMYPGAMRRDAKWDWWWEQHNKGLDEAINQAIPEERFKHISKMYLD